MDVGQGLQNVSVNICLSVLLSSIFQCQWFDTRDYQ